ncbi:MAG TPA: penicillin-binding protein 2 [Acidobacteria bacterium]|nr:penicillin-binding protein 2 [Acidobacteriota bacterium]
MSRRRLLSVAVALLLAALAVTARAVVVMGAEHGRYARMARRQQQQTLTVPSLRGEIRSRDGYLLATSVDRVAIQVDRRALSYPRLFARAAAPLLGRSPDALLRRLESGPRMVWAAQQVDPATAAAVRRLAPSAVVLVPDSSRLYPMGRLAAPVIGFTGREELRTVGRSGLEHYYDTILAGTSSRYLAVRDAVQRRILLRKLSEGRAGCDLRLTLDARLQAACEEILSDMLHRVDARSASAVVLDPATGGILALASVPGFDPSAPGDADRYAWRCHPIQDAFEPGSTLKPLAVSAALAADVIRPGERFDCTHHGIEIGGHWIRDHARPGVYTIDGVVAQSSNAAMAEIAGRIPPHFLWRALDGFGLGHRTGIGFPAEAAGTLHRPESWSRLSPSGVAMGQELTATPLQMAVAYAALANGGWLVRPRLVIAADGGSVRAAAGPARGARILDARLARRVCSMLRRVVEEGTGVQADVPGYPSCGKTGTAQHAVAGHFDDAHHLAWFAGFLPWDAPRAVIVVSFEEPRKDYWASSVAAPTFRRIGAVTMRLLHVVPEDADLPAVIARAAAPAGSGGGA